MRWVITVSWKGKEAKQRSLQFIGLQASTSGGDPQSIGQGGLFEHPECEKPGHGGGHDAAHEEADRAQSILKG